MNKIQKLMSAIAAIALIVSVTMMSFTFKPSNNDSTGTKMLAPVTYYFQLGTQAGWDNEDNYETSQAPGKSCSSGSIPCRITFDSSDYTLQEYLNTFANVGALNSAPLTLTRAN